jgi:hypothetical protein
MTLLYEFGHFSAISIKGASEPSATNKVLHEETMLLRNFKL